MSTTGNLISVRNCGFCGYERFQGLSHACSTAPKPKPIRTNTYREDGALTQEEEKEFYRRTLHSRLLCSEKNCDICSSLQDPIT